MIKLLVYSDLHLEFGSPIPTPCMDDADILVLAGDICNLCHYEDVDMLFYHWTKPILYVAGNHEYYTDSESSIAELNEKFKEWLCEYYPHVTFLDNSTFEYKGVHFWGGTTWTDINNANPLTMEHVRRRMNDYRYIYKSPSLLINPQDVVDMHTEAMESLKEFFEQQHAYQVIITHHAPVSPIKRNRELCEYAYVMTNARQLDDLMQKALHIKHGKCLKIMMV